MGQAEGSFSSKRKHRNGTEEGCAKWDERGRTAPLIQNHESSLGCAEKIESRLVSPIRLAKMSPSAAVVLYLLNQFFAAAGIQTDIDAVSANANSACRGCRQPLNLRMIRRSLLAVLIGLIFAMAM